MNKEAKKTYAAPQLTVVTVKAERGYAASRGLGLNFDFTLDAGAETQETWSTNDDYLGSSWS